MLARILVLTLCTSALPGALRAQHESAPEKLDPGIVSSALDTFQVALDERWSYRYANHADFDSAIAALRQRSVTGLTADELGIELQKIIGLGIDAHALVSGYRLPSGGILPFVIDSGAGGFVAFDAAHRAFLADGFPFVTRIDGKEVDAWCAAAATMVPRGSPQYVRLRCLRQLQQLDYWRAQMGLPKKPSVDVELTDASGRARKLLTLPVADSLPPSTVWPPGGSRLLDHDIGYLRLPTMSEETSVPEIRRWMPQFTATIGLIVDVRGNNGGERAALRLLYSDLADPAAPPRVFTAAAYRLHPAHKRDHLAANHFMYRVDAAEWSPPERQAVQAFARTFVPEWQLPAGQFSDWHYCALTRLQEPDVSFYDKPVIVLLDARCFSATDIFLAGLKGMKNVLLLGTASSGGSAFGQTVVLGATGLRLRIGSMASFQADGRLFDCHGIQPDVVVEPRPEYFVGGEDNVLQEAVRRLRAK